MKLKNREIDGVIFDVDGTLLDSMAIWEDAGARYGVAYVKLEYLLDESVAELREAVLKQVEIFYKEEAPLKKGVRKLLEKMKEAKVPMIVATSSDKEQIEAAFERLEIAGYFKEI